MVRSRSSSVKPLSAAEVRDEGVDALFLVWLASRSVADLLDDALEPAGLSADELALYSVLASRDSLTPSELARWMAAPATTVSSYMKRLEARGHVVREPNPTDGRSTLIRLTPAGRRTHAAAAAEFRPLREHVAQALGGEDAVVRESLLLLRGVVDDLRAERDASR